MISCTTDNRGDSKKEENTNHRILSQIENVVVIMLENRSFDNLAGWLYDKSSPPKRFIIPIYIPILSLLPFLLILSSKENSEYQKIRF